MHLSYKEIEEIANSVLFDYNKIEKPANIIEIAICKYHLKIKQLPLSEDFSILGLTAYQDTKFIAKLGEEMKLYYLNAGDIVIECRLMRSRLHRGKYRFALAHELAHQILFGFEPLDLQLSFKEKYKKTDPFTPKELKTFEDFNEWQANALASSLLMPKKLVVEFMLKQNSLDKLISYGGHFRWHDNRIMRQFCEYFDVSKATAEIRLDQIGLIEKRSYYEYLKLIEA